MKRNMFIKAGDIVSLGIDTELNVSDEDRAALMDHMRHALENHEYQFITNYNFSIEVKTK
jgi:hypothetical protein